MNDFFFAWIFETYILFFLFVCYNFPLKKQHKNRNPIASFISVTQQTHPYICLQTSYQVTTTTTKKNFYLHIPIIMHQTRVDQSTTKAHVNVILDCCVSDATITYRYNVQYFLVTIGMQVGEIVSK